MVKQDALDFCWHEYYEVSFQFFGDDAMHLFVLPNYDSAINAYVTAIENETIDWCAVHHIWFGRVLNEVDNSWQYRPVVWFGLDNE